MKFFKSSILIICLVIGNACTLDLREDPNAVQPSNTVPNLLLNSVQRNLAVLFQGASTNGMLVTRLQNSGNSTYTNIFNPQSFDGTWNTAYASILQDTKQLIEQADKDGLARHAGMARVISAYTVLLLVDSFGDVPYSQAMDALNNLNPGVDNQSDLYTTAIGLLDKAILDLTTPVATAGGYLAPTAPAPTDLYYANTYDSWVRLANSIKLKAYLNLRLTNPSVATTGINGLIASGKLISTAGQNFVFRYGTNLTDPDSRHPRFVANYPAGGGNYMSNWLMWHMYHGYGASQNGTQGDPRMRFYFYRQVSTNNTDPNNIRCVTATSIPSHYPQVSGSAILDNPKAGRPPLGITVSNDAGNAAWTRTFCYPTNIGYWGRDHVNNEGIPPDAFLRTAWGAYPSGGRFDANVNTSVSATVGMRGAGFQPIMMRSYVNFMLAEATIYLGTTGAALSYFEAGIQNSFDDVRAWTTTGTFGVGSSSPNEGSAVQTFYPATTYTADVSNYIIAAKSSYNAQVGNDAIMNYVAREYWISSFGNGVEAYNLYRRTGMPTGMQPALNPDPGAFPRSYFYPSVFANLNSTIDQKADMTGRIFWDTNSSNLDF